MSICGYCFDDFQFHLVIRDMPDIQNLNFLIKGCRLSYSNLHVNHHHDGDRYHKIINIMIIIVMF